MKITGLLMLPAGGFLVLASMVLLRTFMIQSLFVTAGVGVEILGLNLLARAHLPARRGNE
jgi:hypothetical protein